AGSAIQIDGQAVTINGAPAQGDDFRITPSSPTLSVFQVLDKAVIDLSTPLKTGSQIAQSAAENLRNIDQVMAKLQATRAGVGETLNRIDNVNQRLAALKFQGESDRSSAEDVDMVQAISDFQSKQTGYDAALKS